MKKLLFTLLILALFISKSPAPSGGGGGSGTSSGGVTTNIAYLQTAFLMTNFPAGWNGLYVRRTNQVVQFGGQTVIAFDYTNSNNGLYHFTNDYSEGYFLLATDLVNTINAPLCYIAPASIANWSVTNTGDQWQDNTATPINASAQWLTVSRTKSLQLANGLLTSSNLLISPNGNNYLGTVGLWPFQNTFSAMLESYQPFTIQFLSGTYSDLGDVTVTLQQGQGCVGATDGSTTLNRGVINVGISNYVAYLNLYGGRIAGSPSGMTIQNVTLLGNQTGNYGADTIAINQMTNCTWANITADGFENVFQGSGYGTNTINNCYFYGTSLTNDTEDVTVFYTSTSATSGGTFNINNCVFSCNNAFGKTIYPSSCIGNNESNVVYNLNGVTLLYYGGKGETGIKDNTGTAVFNGSWTENGTNMIGYGVAGKTGYATGGITISAAIGYPSTFLLGSPVERVIAFTGARSTDRVIVGVWTNFNNLVDFCGIVRSNDYVNVVFNPFATVSTGATNTVKVTILQQ